jgi:PST family polysaccharide transporter
LARSSGTLYVADAHHRVYVVDPDQMPIAGMPLDGWPPIHTPAQPPPPDEQAPPRQSEPTRGEAPPKAGVRSAVFWSYALTAGRVGTTTIVTFVLAKLLGPSEFGVVAMALLFLTIAQTLLQQGLVSAIIQREDLTDEHLDAAFVILLLSGLGMGVVMAAGSPLWALAFGEPQLTAVCLAFAPLLLVQALAVVPEAVLRRAMGFRAIAVRTLVATISGGVVGIVLAVLGFGVWALVWQQVVTAVVGAVVLWAISPWRPRLRGRLRAIRDLWGFSAHSANAALALQLGGKADQFVIGLFFGPVAIGIYRLAARLPEMFVDVTVRSLQQVALPALSRLQDDRPAFAARLASLQHLGAVAGLPMLGVLAATAEALVAFLGPQWDGTALPLQLLCLYGAVNVYGVLLGPALQAIGKPGRLAAIAWARGVIGVLVFLAVGLLAAGRDPGGQAAAVALSAVAVQVVLNTAAIQVTRRTIATKLRLLTPTLPAVAAALAAAAVPFAADRLGVADATPILRMLVDGTLGAGAAGLVLFATDRRLRTMVRGRLRPSTKK